MPRVKSKYACCKRQIALTPSPAKAYINSRRSAFTDPPRGERTGLLGLGLRRRSNHLNLDNMDRTEEVQYSHRGAVKGIGRRNERSGRQSEALSSFVQVFHRGSHNS